LFVLRGGGACLKQLTKGTRLTFDPMTDLTGRSDAAMT